MRRIVALGLAGLAAVEANAASLTFDRVFTASGEPASLHYHVVYLAGGAAHHLDVWRDGDRRVKRVTDQAIASYAVHRPGDPTYSLAILDMKRRISTRIDRTNLYRIGNFTDWFDLGHGLRHPRGTYSLSRAVSVDGAPKPVARCRWYDLREARRATRICWDTADRIPLLIVAADRSVLWRVTSLDRRNPPPATFAIRDEGFVHNDANQDIAND